MSTDNLFTILAMVRAEMPDISDASWDEIKRLIGTHAGGNRVYVPSQPKRSRLEQLAELGADADAKEISKKLGVSVSRVYQLKRLRR